MKNLLKMFYRFVFFCSMVGFVITSNMMLFLNVLKDHTEIVYNIDNIRTAAIFTFWNAVFLGFLLTVIDFIRRKVLVERPVKKILDVTDRITHGDFSARIAPMHIGEYNKVVYDLNRMAKELSNNETLKTDFISNVSHELKTPLAVLQNYGVLLEQSDLSEEKRIEYAKSITRVTKHLSELITNILKLNKLENQNIYPVLKRCNLSEMLCECLVDFENEWESKNIEIENDIAEDVFINTDAELLMIVWSNLISNAIKFTQQGGKIEVGLKSEGMYVEVIISDNGCGMNERTIKRIFDKFYQADSSHATKGNGLGLALVKRVIDLLNGEIFVESAPNVGSTFTVRLRKN